MPNARIAAMPGLLLLILTVFSPTGQGRARAALPPLHPRPPQIPWPRFEPRLPKF